MPEHALDVVGLFPALCEALSDIMVVLVEQGLEIYPREGRWYWCWRTYHTEAAYGTETMGEALAAALTFRLRVPPTPTSATVN